MMRTALRRRRQPKPKPGELIVWWGQLEKYDSPDLVASWGGAGARKGDGGLVLFELNPAEFMLRQQTGRVSLLKELERRGYDLNTFEFRIRRNWQSIVEA